MMKLCFSTLGCHDLGLKEILKIAEKYDVSAIEVRGMDGKMSNEEIDCFDEIHAEKTKTEFKQAHVKPLILGTSCKFHDSEKLSSMMEKSYQEVNTAKRLGFQAIRVFGNRLTEQRCQCIKQVASALDQLCQYAKTYSIQVYLEVHGDFNTVEVLEELISKMMHKENFALIWDIYHTHAVYGKNWLEFYEAMKPWIRHVHIKDCKAGQLTLPGEGELEIVSVINTLLKDGYQGYFSLEWERKWHPELCELDTALKALITLLKGHQIQIER